MKGLDELYGISGKKWLKPKVASYEMLCFGIGQLSGKILNPEIISLIPYNNGISRPNYFHAL